MTPALTATSLPPGSTSCVASCRHAVFTSGLPLLKDILRTAATIDAGDEVEASLRSAIEVARWQPPAGGSRAGSAGPSGNPGSRRAHWIGDQR